MTLREKQSLFVFNISLLIQWAYKNGYELTFSEAYRTAEQQAYDVAHGLSKTSNSKHLERLAIDLNLFKNGALLTSNADYKPLGNYWVSLNTANTWGGDFSKTGVNSFIDSDHFEMEP